MITLSIQTFNKIEYNYYQFLNFFNYLLKKITFFDFITLKLLLVLKNSKNNLSNTSNKNIIYSINLIKLFFSKALFYFNNFKLNYNYFFLFLLESNNTKYLNYIKFLLLLNYFKNNNNLINFIRNKKKLYIISLLKNKLKNKKFDLFFNKQKIFINQIKKFYLLYIYNILKINLNQFLKKDINILIKLKNKIGECSL